MLVPKYWAEAREQYRAPSRKTPPRQITLRRLGWSDISQEDAQQHAQQRVHEAMQQVLEGKIESADITRYERKFAYNGADGIPIREEKVHEQGDSAITRNAYGALCLNTPDVMFIDFDIPKNAPPLLGVIKLVIFLLCFAAIATVFTSLWRCPSLMNLGMSFLATPLFFSGIISFINSLRKTFFILTKN